MERYSTARVALLATILILAGCSQSSSSTAQSSTSPEASATVESTSPQASATGAGTPVTYTDIGGTPAEKYITDLGALGVFGTPSGAFNPAGTITRADFVKWLVLANNAIFANMPGKQIHLSQSATSAYPDVATSHPDFAYIQGMYDAGFAVGFPDKTFKPDALLTHEQMIAIKESVDRGGVQQYYVTNWDSTMPDWKDRNQINKIFRGAIAEDSRLDKSAVTNWSQPGLVIDNVPRTFGAIAMFRPQDTVTRGQAAAVLWKVGAHSDDIRESTPDDTPRSAADALAPASPTPSPTP
ncbi:MAG: S-layer homology domain-containing protein [Candidatus Eremiobacteraeota bacterium]|nr:S-layer homology domain-containing protein [Candidatus Eremiobacteraeota bacterium]